MGKLTDKAIQTARPKEKQYSLADGDGLVLIVRNNGTKIWWLRYRFNGKAKTLSIGVYPIVTLKDARDRALDAKRTLSNGVDPSTDKIEKRVAAREEDAKADEAETVEFVVREWFEKFSMRWVEGHASKIIRRFERDLFPSIGKTAIKNITPAQLLTALRRVEARGAVETAHRLLQNCGQVWRYAVATGRADRDISNDLKGALPPSKEKHLGALTAPNEIATLLLNIDEYAGSEIVRHALQLAPHVFVRPGELRQAKWTEFDFEKRLWTIPAGRMKAKRPHVVPLSSQTMRILDNLRMRISCKSEYLFPSPRAMTRCISDVALLAALRRMGYSKDEMTAHGFRAMASTNLEQLGFDSRLIEIQLAHADLNEIRAAYKRETHLLRLDERIKMMQSWSNYLDGLKLKAGQ